MQMRGSVTTWDEKFCVCLGHIALLITSVCWSTPHPMTRDERSKFFFSYFFTPILAHYHLRPHATHPRLHEIMSTIRTRLFFFFLFWSSSVSIAHARNRVSHLHPVSFHFFLSFFFTLIRVHHYSSSASTAHAHATRPHAIASTIRTW